MTFDQLPRNLRLKIGDPVEFRADGAILLRTQIAGIEICDPWLPTRNFGFLLPRDLAKEDVPIGSEVWVD